MKLYKVNSLFILSVQVMDHSVANETTHVWRTHPAPPASLQ